MLDRLIPRWKATGCFGDQANKTQYVTYSRIPPTVQYTVTRCRPVQLNYDKLYKMDIPP